MALDFAAGCFGGKTIQKNSTKRLILRQKSLLRGIMETIKSILKFFIILGAAGVLVGYPFDTVKVRIQTQNVKNRNVLYTGTFQCLSKLIKNEGVS